MSGYRAKHGIFRGGGDMYRYTRSHYDTDDESDNHEAGSEGELFEDMPNIDELMDMDTEDFNDDMDDIDDIEDRDVD